MATEDKVDLFVGTYGSAVSNTASDAALRFNKLYWETLSVVTKLTGAACRTFKSPARLLVGTGDAPESLESVGAPLLRGLLAITYPHTDVAETFGPGAKAYLDACRAKFKAEPIALQGMADYVGMQILFEAIKTAGSTNAEKVRDSAAKMDKPVGSNATATASSSTRISRTCAGSQPRSSGSRASQ